MLFRQDNVDNITRGLWRADADKAAGVAPPGKRADLPERGSDEQWAAYHVKRGLDLPRGERDDDVLRWHPKIAHVWRKWQAMDGDNPPLERSYTGPRRDFDINLDGMAHYGMLPDLLQDVRNQGLSIDDLAPLFRSAGDYVEVWARCERRAESLRETQGEAVPV